MNAPIKCADCQEWMEAAFAGNLEAALRRRLEHHAEFCADCRAIWREYQQLRRGMRALAELETPARATTERILRTAEEMQKRQDSSYSHRFWAWLLHPGSIAFATLALVVGISILTRQELRRKESEQDPAPLSAPQEIPAIEASVGEGDHDDDKVPNTLQPPAQATANTQLPPIQTEVERKKNMDLKTLDSTPADTDNLPAGSAIEKSPAMEERASEAGKPKQSLRLGSETAFDDLLLSAQAEIRQNRWNTALDVLLKAQQIRDTEEIQALIALCRSHLRGDE